MTADPRCGTYAGAVDHQRRGEPLDDACQAARREYMANWRRRRPAAHDRNVTRQRASDRALRRLAKLHPADMRALYEQELRRVKGATT